MLIETLHSLMVAGFLAVWLLVGYVTMREMARKRGMSTSDSHDSHRFDATHTSALPSPRSGANHADRRSAGTTS